MSMKNKHEPSSETTDLKASDFFPPGAGWNQGDEESDESISTQNYPADQDPAEHDDRTYRERLGLSH
jgi:hypothetical protein